MLKKVNDLIGAELDWAVAKCLGYAYSKQSFAEHGPFKPSTDWAQGGPIIEREKIHWGITEYEGRMIYIASIFKRSDKPLTGPTPLIAAMRCFVASKLGYEVEIPDELIKK